MRVLGGLMALGYEIGTIMRRRSVIFMSPDGELSVKLDEIENLGEFVQVGSSREAARAAADMTQGPRGGALTSAGPLPRESLQCPCYVWILALHLPGGLPSSCARLVVSRVAVPCLPAPLPGAIQGPGEGQGRGARPEHDGLHTALLHRAGVYVCGGEFSRMHMRWRAQGHACAASVRTCKGQRHGHV